MGQALLEPNLYDAQPGVVAVLGVEGSVDQSDVFDQLRGQAL